MAGKSKKRSADEAVEDPDEKLRSPSSRSRVEEANDEEEEAPVKQEEEEMEDPTQEEEELEGTQEEEEEEEEQGGSDAPTQETEADADDAKQEENDEGAVEQEEDRENDQQEDEEVDEKEQEEGQQDKDEEENMAEEDPQEEAAEDDDEKEEDEVSQSIRRPINEKGRPAEAGVIKTVNVENFMCHRKLTVELGRNVNFIHGQNGSGKSAILAAIQICLGANARRTHRARNIKDLVRKEAAGNNPNTSAKVRVTILNGGGDGYKPELYGDRITVERSINLRGGYNGYRLLNAEGKEVSKKKHDLDEMLDFLNIQVDNPVAILDQEEAKKFLTGKASDKHAFFMKATELERIDRTFVGISDRADELEDKKARLVDSLGVKKEIAKTLKAKVDEFQAVEKLEKKRLDAEVDYAWAFFAERNKEHEQAIERMETFKQKAEAKLQELTQAEEEASGANDENEEKRIKDKMEELKVEAESQAKLKRDLEAEVKLAQNPVKQIQRQLKKMEGEKKSANQSLARAKKRLKETREEIMSKAGSAESEEARRTAQLNETEEALTRAKAETDQRNEAVSVAYRDYEEHEPEFEQTKQVASSKGKQCYAVKSKLRDLTSSASNDPAAMFGKKCSQMFKMVEEARRKRRFRGEVIGPIGAFLKIAPGKDKYAELAEVAIGNNTLDRFIVTCDHDRKEFQKLRDQIGCFRECGIFQVKPSRRFTIPPPPVEDIETVASVLVVSNDIVFNCLVDNARIDQRALAPSKEVSEQRLLMTGSNGRYAIRGNITEVTFLPRGDKWTVRDGAISLSSNDKKAGKRIGVDRTQAIEEVQGELRHLEGELKELKAAETDANKKRLELQKKWNETKRAKRANEDAITELTRKKEEIVNEMETTANTTIDTTEMEEDVTQAEETLGALKDKEGELKAELEKLKPGVEDARKKLEEVETRNEAVLADMKKSEDSLDACLERLTQSELDLQKKRDRLKKYQNVVEEHQTKVEETTTEHDNALHTARKLTLHQKCKAEQVETADSPTSPSQSMTQEFNDEELEQVEIRSVPKDVGTYEAKVKRMIAKIAKEKERRDLSNEDPTVATEKYLRARQDLLATQEAHEETATLLGYLARDMKERRKRWSRLRNNLERMTDSRFDEILQLNQSSGQLEFDDETNELNLVVQKNINDPNSQTKDVKALSGGERSYTTISLLLALGESLETPFRVLDEFDVFLDPQARKLTIQTLIHVAKKMEHRQFIFITPQDLSSVKPDDKVKIFKLKNPDRGNQLAGGMTQQTLDFRQS